MGTIVRLLEKAANGMNSHTMKLSSSSADAFPKITCLGKANGLLLFKSIIGKVHDQVSLGSLKRLHATWLLLFSVSFVYGGTFYSQGSLGPHLTGSWNNIRTGGGTAPTNFTSGDVFVIQNGHNMTTTAVWAISGASSKLQIENGGILTANHAVTLSSATAFQIDGGGTYIHNNTSAYGSSIFQGIESFASTSTVTLNNSSTSGPSGVAFGNLTVNFTTDPGGSVNCAGGLTTINGNLVIQNTSIREFRLTGASGFTLAIAGNVSITGGALIFTTGNASPTINVSGNWSQSDGTVNCQAGNGTTSINISGNWSHTGGTLTETGSGSHNAQIKFIKIGSQTFATTAGGSAVIGNIDFTVNSGSSLSVGGTAVLDASVLKGRTFTLSSGATLEVGSTIGITSSSATGNIQATTRNLSTAANYIYNGTSGAQAAGDGLPTTVNNLTISNTSGVTLPSVKTITGNLSIASGSFLSLGTYNHSAGSLTLGGNGTTSGSWGSTSSSATNKNDTYFAPGTTGMVNVSTSTCTPPSITPASSTSNVCFSPLAQTTQLTYTNATNSPDKYSITWNASATAAGFTPVTDATLPASPITINIPAGTTPGTYTGNISVKNSATGCTSGTTPFTITVTTVASATLTIAPGTNVCEGTEVTYSTQVGQTNYLWTVSGTQGTDYTITAGSTSTTSNSVTIKWIKAGTYNVNVSYTSGTCAAVPATSTTTVNAPPAAFAVSGGGSYCNGGSGVTVNLSGSETGVTYQLKNGAVNTGSSVAGTGSALSFNNITAAGTYMVVATNTATNCTATMSGSASVSVTPRPMATVSNTTAAICNGGSTNITGTVSATGAWTLTLTNGGGAYNGASGATTFSIAVSPSTTTNYSVASLTDASGCTTMPGDLTGSATVTVNATPTLGSASQAAPICAGTSATVNLTGLVANSTATISYSINGVAQPQANVTADASGNGNFATPVLTAANNNQTLTVTGITITGATPGCSASFTQNAMLSVSTCSVPTDYYVNDNSTSGDGLTGSVGNDGNPGTQASPFATIGHAITVAPSGSTIHVDAGTYNESVIVNKALVIKGIRAGELGKGRSGAESVLDPASSTANGFKIVADNVTIDGFTITNSAAYPPSGERSGVITIEKASTGNFTGIVVKNNLITRQYKAVNFNYTDNFEISRNWLHGESASYNYGCMWIASYGLSSANGLITNNDLDGYNSAVEIQGNLMQPVSNITVSENRSTGSQYVLFGLQNSTVYRNAVLNVTTGSHVFIGGGCTNSTFSENFFDNGSSSGIRVTNPFGAGVNANLAITNNSITGHSNAGFYEINVDAAAYTGSLAATCNWFGTTDNASIAVKLNGPVTYMPYLTNGMDYAPSTAGFQPVPGSCNSNQTEFYVDDNSNTGDVYTTTATGNDITGNGTQTAPYATIAKAISIAPAGATIYVDAGLYAENVNVTKSLTILGSNAGINPNTGTRVGEAVIVPATNNVASGRIIDVKADNVTIKGFTLDGDNTAINGGYAANGADNNAALGIACGDDPLPDGFNNLLAENNIIKNLGNDADFNTAFYGSGSQSGAKTGSNFQNNKVDNTVLWGIVTENNFYANVQNNVITRTGRGIQLDNTWIGGVPVTIANNNVKYYRRGILVNLRYGTASPVAVSGNTIQPETSGIQEAGTPGAAAVNRGLLIWSIAAGAGNVTLTDNNISNAWYGEELWNNAPGKVSQTGGVLNNNQYGIYLPTNQDAYGNAGYGSNASVTRVTISNSTADGVWLNDNNASANTINLSLTNAFITGGANSVHVSGNDVAATVNNNSLTGSTAKAIDASGFTGGTPISATCNWYGSANNAVVAAKVSGNAAYMPYLTDGTDSDLPTSGFQPAAGSCNSAIQFYVNDGSTANGVYTTSVGNDANPGTPSQPFATISHAVLVAPAGATIYVDAGTYQEQVIINKSLSIVGAGRSGGSITKILSPGTVSSEPTANGTTRAIVLATGVSNAINISKVLIDGNGVGGSGFTGVYYDEASGTFENSRITGIRDATFSGVQSGDAFVADHEYYVSKPQTVTVTGNIIDDYQKSGIVIDEQDTHGIVTNNTIIGQNTRMVNGQNGIQFAFGSYGTITGNTVSNNLYNDPTNAFVATGILIAGVGVDKNNVSTVHTTTVSNNTLTNNDAGLYSDAGGYGYDSNAGLTEGPNTYAANYTHVSVNAPAALPNSGNAYDKRVDNTAETNTVYGQIQRAVDYASAGNVLNASGHTFTEQVEIPKNLTLNGAGASTVILSPATLPLSFTSSATNRPVVYAHDAATVVLNNFTVDGAGKGNANNRFVGIGYSNAGGTVQNTDVKGIRNNPIDGVQGGTGIVAFANNGTARTLNVTNNNIHDFQKNATAFSGANLTVNVNGNTITGAGAVAFIAQNGVQISSGATGAITNNTVSGFAYTGTAPASSAGILVFGASGSVSTSGNTVNDAQVGVYYSNAGGTITANSINYNAANMGGTYWYGIDVENGTVTATQNNINGDGNGAGIEADYVSGDVTNLTATNNFIDKTDEAFVVWTDGTGGTATSVINENSITNYTTAAVHNYGTSTANATCNWYGTTDNSVIAPKIMGPVTYVPYLVNGTDNDATTAGFQPVPASCSGSAALVASIASQTNVACFGGATGSVTVVASGGVPGYQYSIDGGANYGTSGTFANLLAGSYTVTAKDAAGNTTTVPVTITQPPVLTVSATQMNIACYGGSNGSITATAGGGTPGSGYQYSLSGPVNVAFSSTNVFSNLPAGTYTVTAKDAAGCTKSVSKTILAPTATTADVQLATTDITDSYFPAVGSSVTVYFEIRELNGNPAMKDTLRITNQSGYTFSLSTAASFTSGGYVYPVDNARWAGSISSNSAFYNVALNSGQQIDCGQAVYLAVTITRNNPSKSNFTLTSRVPRVQGETNNANNSTIIQLVGQ